MVWASPPTYLEQLEKDLGEVLAVLLFEVEELTDALRQGHASGPAYFAVFPEGDERLKQRGADLDYKLPVVLRADDLKFARAQEKGSDSEGTTSRCPFVSWRREKSVSIPWR